MQIPQEMLGERQAEKPYTQAFSLVETLVAVTILVVAVAGPLTLATRSLFSAFVARDQLTASFLAQDAVEYVRFIRDSNILSGDYWLSDPLTSCIFPQTCRVDSEAQTVEVCGASGCPPLRLHHNEGGLYGYDFSSSRSEETSFVRSVTLTEIQPDEYALDVMITWRTGTLSHSFTVQEHLYDWPGL